MSIFPSDEMTLDFMRKQQGREKDWVELKADPDAKYDRIIKIDLSEIEPMIACPDSPGNVKTVREVEGLKVDQIAVGSCTNSSYRDLMTVAKILKGKVACPDLEFGVAPGSRQLIEMVDEADVLETLLKAGARIFEAA